MRNILASTLVGASLLLTLGSTANAQYPPRGEDRYRYERGDGANRYDRGHEANRDWAQRAFVSRTVERLRVDLNRADDNTVPFVSDFNGDRDRISRARQELNEFQSSWSAGQFNGRQLDHAIAAVQRVLDQNRLSDRSRDMLASDLNRMRGFRASYE
jgi:hypothetical protein